MKLRALAAACPFANQQQQSNRQDQPHDSQGENYIKGVHGTLLLPACTLLL
jgi:hypothetical protein